MNTTPNSENFPQFSQGTASNAEIPFKFELDNFRFYPAIQNRPFKIESIENEDYGILFTFSTIGKKAVLSYTHETSLYLYSPAPITNEFVYLHIHLWTDEIFRVVFSKEKEIKNPCSKLPKDAQMLIGEPNKVDYSITEHKDTIVITTKKIEIKIDKQTTTITANFLDGTEFFSQKKQNFETADIHELGLAKLNDNYACFEALELENDEIIYGLGERFDSFTRNGRTVDFHNKDAVGTTSRRTYINIPFYLSTKGYGLFLNSSAKTDWQIGTTDTSALQFSVLDSQLDYFVISGKTLIINFAVFIISDISLILFTNILFLHS